MGAGRRSLGGGGQGGGLCLVLLLAVQFHGLHALTGTTGTDFSAIGKLFIDESSGNVGIGDITTYSSTAVPEQKLTVNGNLRVNGNIVLKSTNGANLVSLESSNPTAVTFSEDDKVYFGVNTDSQRTEMEAPLDFTGDTSADRHVFLQEDDQNALTVASGDTSNPLLRFDTSSTGELLVGYTDAQYQQNFAIFYSLTVGKDTTIGGSVAVLDATEAFSPDVASVTFAGGLGVAKNAYVGGTVSVTDTTEATSNTAASVMLSGGLAVAKDTYIGGTQFVTGYVNVTDSTEASSYYWASVTTAGGLGVTKNVITGGTVEVQDTTDASSATSASMITAGGLGVSKSVVTGGTISVLDTTEAASPSIASITTLGGLGVAKDAQVGGNLEVEVDATIERHAIIFYNLDVGGDTDLVGSLVVQDDLDATSETSAAVTFLGGLGVSKSAVIGGTVSVTKTLDATSTTSASVVTAGGMGVAKSLYVGGDEVLAGDLTVGGATAFAGDFAITSTTDSTSTTTGSITTTGGLGVSKSVYIGGTLSITDTTETTSKTTGSITTAGGVGVSKSLYVGVDAVVEGNTNILGDLDVANNADIGDSMTIFYNLDVGNAVTVGGLLTFVDTTDASSVAEASTVLKGGLGVAKSAIVGGQIIVTDTTESTSTGSGSVYTSGGVGVAKDMYVGGSINAAALTTSSSDIAVTPGASFSLTVGAGESIKLQQDTYDMVAVSTAGALSMQSTLNQAVTVTSSGSTTVDAGTSMALQQGSETRVELASTGAITIAAAEEMDLSIKAGGKFSATSDDDEFLITAGAEECAEFRIQQACFYGVEVGGTPTDKMVIDNSGGITLNVVEGNAFSVLTERDYSSYDANVTATNNFLNGYQTSIKKQVSLTTSYTTVATVKLASRDSVFVKVVIEGEWSSAPSIYVGEYFIMHNNGAAPEPSTSSGRTGVQREFQAVGDGTTDNAYVEQTDVESSGSDTKEFYLQFATSGTSAPSVTAQAIITIEGTFSSAE